MNLPRRFRYWLNRTGRRAWYWFFPTVSYVYKGEKQFIEENALARLLLDGVLFCNSRQFVDIGFGVADPNRGKVCEETIVLFVNCNDLFAWGCADAEAITTDEIEALYNLHINKKFGVDVWCCLKRNEQPQRPVKKAMQEAGEWTPELQALPENRYDKACAERTKGTCAIHAA